MLTSPTSERHWLRDSLPILLILLLLSIAAMSWVTVKVRRARVLQEPVKAVERLGGSVVGVGTEGPDWLRNLLGCDVFLDAAYYVSFVGPAVTDAGLDRLRGWNQLRGLELGGAKVTDAMLEHLRGLSQLVELDLEGTSVSDAGLEHLKGLSQLERIWFLNCSKVTDEGLEKLRQALPKCSVRRDPFHSRP